VNRSDVLIDGRPMRVLALSDHLGHAGGKVHGGTTYFVSVLPALAEAGVELTVCFMSAEHPAAEPMRQRGVEPLFLNRHKLDPRAYGDVNRIVAERDIQMVHLASFKSHYIGRLIARRHHLRSIIHLHDTKPLPLPIRLLQKTVANYTDLALAVSNPVGDLGVSDYGLQREKVRTLHNGIDVERFAKVAPVARSLVRGELGLAADAKAIGIVGRLAEMKGQPYAIRAMPIVLQQVPGAVLVLVGEGETRSQCESLVRELALERSVKMVGQRSNMPEVLAALDVVAMPSLFGEGLPYAAIEAIAGGRPVVAFPTAGIPEVVVDGESGLLVPRGDVDALASALVRVLGDATLCKRLSEGARRHAQRFTIEHHVETLIGIYREFLTKPAQR
jgi:glycosyltransferase involved in cell wall biosynthesis